MWSVEKPESNSCVMYMQEEVLGEVFPSFTLSIDGTQHASKSTYLSGKSALLSS